MKREYYEKLINRLYYALVQYEKYPMFFKGYLLRLVYETGGNQDFSEMRGVYYMLNFLYMEEDVDHAQVKKVILDSIDVVDMIIGSMGEGTSVEQAD